ncbi:ABC transporter substrate-binding protein [Rhodococcus globerulus]|uniref:ABC transporter substrate-binding protein n=1 Tax=Rhodococcus globerulus TaxID=33008 RepID=UPI000A8EA7FA|nr:ABC transporter substrate-binding protein [Rhodococcus globerulus]
MSGSATEPLIEGRLSVLTALLTRALTAATGLLCTTALLTGCSSATAPDAATPTTVAADAAGPTSYPLTLENCGVSVTFDSAPQRAVSLYQSATEILLSLGLGDRMVGTSTWFDPVLAPLAAQNDLVPRLADNDASLEVVLDTEPDLVTSASAHTFTSAVVAERARFAELGIPTYQSPSVCTDAVVEGENVSRTATLTIDTLYREIRELAAIFDVQDRGTELIAELQSRLSQAAAGVAGSGRTLAFWFSGLQAPYMAGCCSAPGLLADEAGAVNVFADLSDDWPEVSWEAVADRDPDVLVLGDLHRRRVDGDSLETKIAFLESNPVTAQMTAVRNRNYVTLSGAEMDPGIREIDALEKLADGLRSTVG